MASASVVLRQRTTAEPGDSWESLKAATKDFESILTEQQCTELQKIKNVPDSDAVMVFTAQLDAASRSRKGRSIATRLHSVLQSVQQFASIVDTLVSSHPEIAALVWGSVKFAMLLVSNYTSYFEELSQVFVRFNSYCPIFEEYQALFPTSRRVQEALCKFHVSIIQCCKHAVEAIQRPWQTQVLNIFRQSFDKEFESDILSIRENGRQVKEEIKLAQIQMEKQYQELQYQSQAVVRSDLRKIMSRSKLVNERLEDLQMTQYLHKTRKRDQRLLESLSTHDYSTPLKEACKIRNCNTATWIFSTPEFTSWNIQQGPSLLWCSGKIGSGKTVVTASMIQHLFTTKHKNTVITYFFAQYNDAQSLKAETIVRSIVRQTLNPMDLSEKIKDELKGLDEERFLQFEKVIELLKGRITKFDCFYIILDGLDECNPSERRVLLEAISSLITIKPKLKVFIASRIGLQGEIKRKFPTLTRVSMGVSGAVLDISVYIRESIQQRILDRQLVTRDLELAGEIERRLTTHADGM
uniref:NACHT domain-containing protein n=1 Tax=Bionectria ochroleuca TaxID=29856 RepID=A0A8H7K1T9_BIOOC